MCGLYTPIRRRHVHSINCDTLLFHVLPSEARLLASNVRYGRIVHPMHDRNPLKIELAKVIRTESLPFWNFLGKVQVEALVMSIFMCGSVPKIIKVVTSFGVAENIKFAILDLRILRSIHSQTINFNN